MKLADVFDIVPLFDNSLKLEPGGVDEKRGVIAANVAQHYFETWCATLPRVMQSVVTVATVAQTETTTWTSTLLRLDGIWLIDSVTLLPIRKLKRLEEVGGQAPELPWPLQLTMSPGMGSPYAYYASQANFYWAPLADAAYTLRIYGFVEQSEFTSRDSTFNYPSRVKPAIAAFIAKLLRTSVEDDAPSVDQLVGVIFGPLLKGLRKMDRSEPHGRTYGETHDT